MSANRKFAPGRRYASENRGCYIDRPWKVQCLRHRKGDPFYVAIVKDTFLDMGLGGFLKATDDAICAENMMKRPVSFCCVYHAIYVQ